MSQLPDLNRSDIRRRFDRSADNYDQAAVLQRHIADGLLDRLDELERQPSTILDIGCGTGYLTKLLAQKFPQAHVVGCDLSPKMTSIATSFGDVVCCDAHFLPFKANYFDLVVSSLTLQW